MFFRKKTPMSIYITHGSFAVIKGIAHTHSQHEPDLVATCALVNGEKNYTVKNIEPLIIKIINANHAQKNKLVKLAQSHQGASLSQADFDHFVHAIKTYFKVNYIKLHADGNLFWPASQNVSAELCYLVEKIQPQSLILFSETPECIDDAQNYLHRKPTNNHHQLPNYPLSGAVATRKTLKNIIANEAENPTYIPTQHSCVSFFYNNAGRILRKPKIYPNDETTITYANDEPNSKTFNTIADDTLGSKHVRHSPSRLHVLEEHRG
jgi:hypothetical protein